MFLFLNYTCYNYIYSIFFEIIPIMKDQGTLKKYCLVGCKILSTTILSIIMTQ